MKETRKESILFWLENALSEIECSISSGICDQFSADKQKLLLLEHALRTKEAIEQAKSLFTDLSEEGDLTV